MNSVTFLAILGRFVSGDSSVSSAIYLSAAASASACYRRENFNTVRVGGHSIIGDEIDDQFWLYQNVHGGNILDFLTELLPGNQLGTGTCVCANYVYESLQDCKVASVR